MDKNTFLDGEDVYENDSSENKNSVGGYNYNRSSGCFWVGGG
jgi:hypothetical protein